MEWYLIGGLCLIQIVLLVILLIRLSGNRTESNQVQQMKREITEELRANRTELSDSVSANFRSMNEVLVGTQRQVSEVQGHRQEEFNTQITLRMDALHKTVNDMLRQQDERMKNFALQNEQQLDHMRTTIENRLGSLQEDNNKKLEQMRATVDEKLQKTLEDRISQSFRLVSERLEQVYKGLGEMQTLATGVGDLKKVLSNVKTRGILGEIQLGAILEQILAPEQYDVNVATKKNSRDVVEFAVRLPGDDDGGIVYLPIDSKFPGDVYAKLMDAYDTGDQAQVDQAAKELTAVIRKCAKDIHDKYIDPPNTTDFAIMFLPFEGLYAEVVRRGLVETLQRDFKINIAGPTTMAALLNSLQMGFKTLAIQKRSGEVWNVLGAVKTEFEKFAGVLAATQKRLDQANSELEKLVGVRTRQIQRKLAKVTSLSENDSVQLLDEPDTIGYDESDEEGSDQ